MSALLDVAPIERFAISFVGSKFDNKPERASVTWDELCRKLTTPRRTACSVVDCGTGMHAECDENGKPVGCRHKNGRAWIPATFSAGRQKSTVEKVSMLVVDADHLPDQAALESVLARLERYRLVAHATHSDKPGDRCARIALPLSRTVSAADWPRFWPAAMALLGMPADPSCCDAGRLYYLPARPSGAEFWTASHDGEPLDVDAIIKTAPAAAPTVATQLKLDDSGVVEKGGRHAMLKSLAGSLRHRGAGHAEILAGLTLANQRCNPPKPESVVADIATWAAAQPVTTLPKVSNREEFVSVAEINSHDDIPPPSDDDAPPSVARATEISEPRESGAENSVLIDRDVAARMFRNEKRQPKACGSNIELVLRHSEELRGRVRFNEITRTVEVTAGAFRDEHPNGLDIAIKNWLETKWGLFVEVGAVGKQLLRVARRFGSYDPVKEYLRGLEWDKEKRVDKWLSLYCNVADNGYTRKVGARFLISGAARGLDPGCKVDTVLILRGAQGFRKSSALDVLGGEWFSDSPMELDNKDSRITAASRWIVELGELSSIRQSGLEQHKAFLAARKDYVRPPYGAVNEEFLRHCVFAGTTNAAEFLIDETGNRRFWVVTVGDRIDLDALRRDRDQLWAEAVSRYRDGERWWFDDHEQIEADKVAGEHEEEDPWADKISAWWGGLLPLQRSPFETDGLSLADVASAQLEIKLSDLKRHEKAVGKALRRAGFDRDTTGPARARRWFFKEKARS